MTRRGPWIRLLTIGAVVACGTGSASGAQHARLSFKPVRYESTALVFKLRGIRPGAVRSGQLRARRYRARVEPSRLRRGAKRGILRVRVPAPVAKRRHRSRARLVVWVERRQANPRKPASAASPPPPAPAPDPVVAAAGDIACDPASPWFNGGLGTPAGCRQRYTSDLVVNTGLAAVLTLGDHQYEDGAPAKYPLSFEPTWGRIRGIIRPAVGNHDYGIAGGAGYFDYFNGIGSHSGPAGDRNRAYYSFDIGAWHLIALNSNCAQVGGCGAGSPQELWLAADLAAHPAACTLAYWHQPHFSSGPHRNDDGGANPTGAFWRDLYDGGADLVLGAHDHDYERFAPQTALGSADPARGLREFVVGTGGRSHYSISTVRPNSEVRNSDTFGVLKLVLHPRSYDWSFVPEAGGTFTDAGSAACH
jgi:hypothetical protein